MPVTDLSIDQQLAMRTAASNLAREFDGTFGSETIERFLHSSYDEFADRRRYLDWQADDPAGLDVAEVRPIRDAIERRVQTLLAELGVG